MHHCWCWGVVPRGCGGHVTEAINPSAAIPLVRERSEVNLAWGGVRLLTLDVVHHMYIHTYMNTLYALRGRRSVSSLRTYLLASFSRLSSLISPRWCWCRGDATTTRWKVCSGCGSRRTRTKAHTFKARLLSLIAYCCCLCRSERNTNQY